MRVVSLLLSMPESETRILFLLYILYTNMMDSWR